MIGTPLAGQLPPEEDAGFAALLAKIAADTGFRCASYKERCLRRRVAVRMRARAVHDFEAYAALLDEDDHERDRLLDALTINVTKLFRNPEVYESIAANVVPALWRSVPSELRVWSAGCASGEEPYSLAALFHAHAAAVGDLVGLQRLSIVGTDIDRASLAAAADGSYGEGAFADTAPGLRARYFTDSTPASVAPELRRLVRFRRHDLLQEPGPTEPQHLVVCRNVLIYFDRGSQERIIGSFRDLLAPGGVLVLGKVETLLGDSRTGFVPLDQRNRVFRRL